MTKKIKGLTGAEAESSRLKNGANIFEKEKTKGFFSRFFENLNDPIIKILIIALAIQLIFAPLGCNLFEVLGIVMAILIASLVSTFSELGSERAFLRMQRDSEISMVKVLRDGELTLIPSVDIVVGDIVYLSSGEKILADGVLISGSLSVDQSALNGESREISKRVTNKDEPFELSSKSIVFSGTTISTGEGVMRVLRVGKDTFYGMVARDVQRETRESPLKLRLSRLASQISKIGYVVAIIVALVFLFNSIVVDNGFSVIKIKETLSDFRAIFGIFIKALTLVITIIVVAVPEGLPMMITVVLSANMKRMLRDNVLVKKLVGIETAGSMNILFTDKTGTITRGEPKIERIEIQGGVYKSLARLKKDRKIFNTLLENAYFNTDAYIRENSVIGGNGTDRAIADFFKSERVEGAFVEKKEAFSSDKKYSSVTLNTGVCYIKGAPEIIISKCTHSLTSSGERVGINLSELEGRLRDAMQIGCRVVAVAYKNVMEDSFTFVALIILKDMLRFDSKEAIDSILRAGVQIVMLTGDSRETASAVARECGILGRDKDELVLSSDELVKMSDDEVKKILPRLRVLSRALPQDKTRLVRLSQELELVVGMTGDGINDAPSLKLADVGFAMGSGADIAKSAGDIVILNDSLYSIHQSILYGRTIFKSIRKFIVFQLIMNFTACGVSILGQILGVDTPITIIQMLWVNIIMDTLGGLAFSGEPALPYYMKERPKRRDEPIMTREMICRVLVMGAYSLLICILFLKLEFFRNIFNGGGAQIRFLTAFYALFIFLGIMNSFTARSERLWVFSNIGKNKPFVFIMLLISIIQIIIIFYGGELFRSYPLRTNELSMVILLSLSVIPFDTLRRMLFKKEKG